jgi:hypothetical protein
VSRTAALLLLAPLVFAPTEAVAAGRTVPRPEILAAMRASQGFDPAATTNGPRFQAEVLLRLLRDSQARDPEAGHLFVGHADWYHAFLERTGKTPAEAPLFVRLAFEYRQDLEVDARPGRVVERVVAGPAPRLAANVTIGWPAGKGAASKYSYEDTLAIPDLHVTNERVIAYRLLDYGDLVAFDEIEGLRGRPTEGLLGVLFNVIGEGSVRWNRMTISPEGLQVARARATKGPFGVESTIVVYSDGRVEKDVPPGRADLAALEKRLLETRALRYRPLDTRRAPADAVPTVSRNVTATR